MSKSPAEPRIVVACECPLPIDGVIETSQTCSTVTVTVSANVISGLRPIVEIETLMHPLAIF